MRTSKQAIGIVAVLGLCLAFATGPASAKQVYDYVYSGQYIDGTGSAKGTFPSGLRGVAYDTERESILALVSVFNKPGYITRFTKTGVPVPFSAPEMTDTIPLIHGIGANSDIVVDNSGGPNAGNIYVAGVGIGTTYRIYGFKPDGTPLPGFEQFEENLCGIAVGPQGEIWLAAHARLEEVTINGAPTGKRIEPGFRVCQPAIDSAGNFYVEQFVTLSEGKPVKLDPVGNPLYDLSQDFKVNGFAIDPANNDVYVGQGSSGNVVHQYDFTGVELNVFGGEDPAHSFAGLQGGAQGIAVDPDTHDIWVTNTRDYSGARHIEKFSRTPPTTTVPTTTTEAPALAGATAGLRGTINADGVETTDCRFEWGPTPALGNSVACAEGNVFTGFEDNPVSADLEGLTKGATYYYRLSGKNGNGRPSPDITVKFIAQDKPILGVVGASNVNTDGVRLNADIDPNGGHTSFHFEWGPDSGYGHVTPESKLPSLLDITAVSSVITGLAQDTRYHYRIVITNEAGTVTGEDREFKTYTRDPGVDACPNAQVRKQTESSLLLNCRAYELVSAPYAGGYDVESDLVVGQAPFQGFPRAGDRVLYGLHFGAIPGISGSPTNYGLDPYVASRGSGGWSTRYVGLPADGMPSAVAFGSPLLAADDALSQFAFGGPGICAPCFEDGSSNVPLRLSNGVLTKGMAGSRSPAADPTGQLAKRFSADGRHFFFGASSRFESNGLNGQVSIYDRDLLTNVTQVVSTLPSGAAIAAAEEVGELDVSADGSRVLIGQRLAGDARGNSYWHLYLHRGSDTHSTDLTPGTTSGVLFVGMSADGSRTFFSTKDQLLEVDDDESADLYEARVDSAGVISMRLVSIAGAAPSNDDSCAPAGSPSSWNSPEGDGKCGAVGFAGGAGVAADGTVYFVSPEQLDGPAGSFDLPNLYVVKPGSTPRFVATIDIANPALVNAVKDNEVHRYSDFQGTPDGRYGAFGSGESLTGFHNEGHLEIYRYDSKQDQLECVSCPPTGATPTGDASLAPYGLSLTDDGRVFFTSKEPYVLRDTNERKDAYEWEDGQIQLISTGQSPDDSTLFTVSADGLNAFFFTRQTLAHGDENGSAVKIYDAREGGGFLHPTPPFPCAASDECHGAGTLAPSPPSINTVAGAGVRSAGVKARRCKRGLVKRPGRCVKRHRKARRSRQHLGAHSGGRHSTRRHG